MDRTAGRRAGATLAALALLLGLATGAEGAEPKLQPSQTPAPAPAPAPQPPPTATVVVPVVGNVGGMAGVRWVTSVTLRNDTGAEADVWMLLPTSGDAPAFNVTMRPGETLAMRDVVAEAFGTDTALSPLKVITTGRRSVTIGATVYAVREGKIVSTQPIAIDYATPSFPLRSLTGLSFSDDYRTNIGLANLSEDRPASFTIALQRINGRNISVTHVDVPPVSLVHTSIQTLFPMITKGGDFTVMIECGDPQTYVYGSVIQNSTSNARFVAPVIGAPPTDEAVKP
jgi:hypothetical protein